MPRIPLWARAELALPAWPRELSGLRAGADLGLAHRMMHEPDLFAEFPRMQLNPALTLAGHTHGGQVSLPLIGRRVVPSRYGERYAYGHVVEAGRHHG